VVVWERHSRHLFRFQDCFVNAILRIAQTKLISNEESNEDIALCLPAPLCLWITVPFLSVVVMVT
jgi:hypothetical protein